MLLKLYLILFWLVFIDFSGNNCGLDEKRLLRNLFDQTNAEPHVIFERPSMNESHAVDLAVSVDLIDFAVDEKTEIMNGNMWINMRWSDYHFQWNPDKYNKIRNINIPSDRIWKPDILLFNSADGNFEVSYPVHAIISHTSEVLWVTPVNLKSLCVVDIFWFPFDSRICTFKFGSWTFDMRKVNLSLSCISGYDGIKGCKVDMNYDNYKNAFNLKSAHVTRQITLVGSESYGSLSVRIEVKRNTPLYTYTILVPSVLISVIALVVLLLPPDSGQKIYLGVTVILSLIVLLLLLANKVPRTSITVPLISIYIVYVMILTSISLMFTVFISNLYHRSKGSQAAPYWIRSFINVSLAKIVLMKNNQKSIVKSDAAIHASGEHLPNVGPEGVLSKIRNEIMKITQKILDGENRQTMANEWKFAANVIDRCCIIVFGTFIVIITMVVFLRFSR